MGGVHKWWYPRMDGFQWKMPWNLVIWHLGVPLFQETSMLLVGWHDLPWSTPYRSIQVTLSALSPCPRGLWCEAADKTEKPMVLRAARHWMYGGFLKWGVPPIAGWCFSWKIPSFEMDDEQGYPYFSPIYPYITCGILMKSVDRKCSKYLSQLMTVAAPWTASEAGWQLREAWHASILCSLHVLCWITTHDMITMRCDWNLHKMYETSSSTSSTSSI